MPNEIELKLCIAPKDIPQLRRHRAVRQHLSGKPVTRRLVSIYFDTPDLKLLDAGTSLRVRRMSGQWFQAVKSAGQSLAGLHQRMEWEDIITRGEPDFSKINDPSLTGIFDDPVLRASLRPIFSTDVRRTEWQLVLEDGSRVEVALDSGELIAGESREPICEVELELKEGHSANLFELARTLMDDIPLWIENISKAQRGYNYYRPQLPQPVRADIIDLSASMTAADACRNILWGCLAQLQGNHETVTNSGDAEGVHQMRVALRRMRSAIAIFRKMLAEKPELIEDLRWLVRLLGEVRDLDVFAIETLQPVQDQLNHPGVKQLQKRVLQERQAALAELRAALESQRYQRLLLDFGTWLESILPRPIEKPLQKFAKDILQKRQLQLCRHGKNLQVLEAQERHALRIAAKKLRYASEFFSSLYPARKTRRYLSRLTQLQDVLGALNDISVAESLLGRMAKGRSDQSTQEARGILMGWNGLRAKRNLARLNRAWDRFQQTKPFWN